MTETHAMKILTSLKYIKPPIASHELHFEITEIYLNILKKTSGFAATVIALCGTPFSI
jgi:hypothetical protein